MNLILFEPLLLEILIRGFLLAAAGTLVGRCLRSAGHRWRHGASLFFLASLCLLPAVIVAGWRWELPLTSWEIPVRAEPGSTSEPSWLAGGLLVLLSIWFLGMGWRAIRLFAAHASLARLRRRALPFDDRRELAVLSEAFGLSQEVTVAVSPCLTRPIVCGLRRPTILLPMAARDWKSSRLRWVLAHELAHVRRRDLWIQVGVQWLCAIHWPNPFVRHLARVVEQEREIEADRLAVAVTGNDRRAYASDLLLLVQESRRRTASGTPGDRLAAAAMLGATSSKLEDRVRDLLRAEVPRSGWGKATMVSGGLGLLLWVSCCLVDPFVGDPRLTDPIERDAWIRLTADPFPGN